MQSEQNSTIRTPIVLRLFVHSATVCRLRDLGVLLDSQLSMRQHISKVASRPTCHYHLRRLRQIRIYVSPELIIHLVMYVTDNVTHCLLQLCASWTPIVYNFFSQTGPEYSRSAHSRPQSTIIHHSCPTTTPLATS